MASARRKLIWRAAAIAALCLVIAGLAMSWVVAGKLVAPKRQTAGSPPPDLGAKAFVVASDSGSTVHGWHTCPEGSDGVVVLLHGMGGSRWCMLERARLLHASGYATVMIDFQAHGESPGEAITAGYLERHDVRAAVAFARREHPDEPIGVIGVSLGGAAAVLASPLGVEALVVESVYPTINEAIRNRVKIRLGPLAPLPSALLLMQLKPRFGISPSSLRPINHLRDAECPLLILSGEEDRRTTATETQAMFAAAANPKELWLVPGAGHVDLLEHSPNQYRAKVLGFLNRHLRQDRDNHKTPGPLPGRAHTH